jgi:tryptophan-rich sensory protein
MIMFNTIWYDNLIKPALHPPAWIFSPVWIILYGTIFTALILYTIKATHRNKLSGYIYFIVQMILNLAWSPIFFYFHNIGLALIVIILLDMSILINIIKFYKVSKLSGLILIPYFLWVLFATYLNISFFILN